MDKVKKAAELGKQAFHAGKMGIPALDKDLMNLFKDLKPGEALSMLKAWAKDWHAENLRSTF